MQDRTWRNVKSTKAEKIRTHLLEHGGVEEEVKSAPEAWRIKFSDSTFTYYKKGTLYSTLQIPRTLQYSRHGGI